MRFSLESVRGNFPYKEIKRSIHQDKPVFIQTMHKSIQGIPLDTYERNRIDYLGVLKMVKKYEKRHARESIFLDVFETVKKTPWWEVHGVRLSLEFDERYPQYCAPIHDMVIVGHRSLNLSKDELATRTIRKTNSHMELDVCLTASQHAVVHHDLSLSCGTRMSNIQNIDEYNLVTLSDVLSLVDDTCKVYIDIKGDDPCICGPILRAVEESGVPVSNVVAMSFDEMILREMRRRSSCICLCFLSANTGSHDDQIAMMRSIQCEMIALDCNAVTPSTVEPFHAHGIRVFAYTSNNIASMLDLARCGLDGIITDVPNLFKQEIHKRTGKKSP